MSELHKLLHRQLKKFLPEATEGDERFDRFLQAISDSYFAFERDKELSSHAFSLTEKEYNEINTRLIEEVRARQISIGKLKDSIVHVDEKSGIADTHDDLVYIAEYIKEILAKHRETEDELRRNNKRITSLVGSLHSGVLMESEDRRIVFTNEKFCEMFQIPAKPDQLLGYDCELAADQSKVFFKDQAGFLKRIGELLTKKEKVIGDELELIDGRVFERDFVPVFIDQEYKGHLWNYTDITERKKIQDAVAASEEKYRNIINNMNLGLLEVDTGEFIQYSNQGFTEISGYSPEELIGKKTFDVLLADGQSDLINDELNRRRQGLSGRYELKVKHKNGEDRIWLISAAPRYNDKGELIGTVAVHLDITDQKRLELEIEAALVKAREASKAKEAFLANMSHEIRTPLNAIIGMIRELGRENPSPEQKSYILHSETAAKHLLGIVNNILDISKIEAGELTLENKEFSLVSVINMAHSILYSKAAAKGLKFTVAVSPDMSDAFIGDGNRLRQILVNILDNAIKFTEKGSVHLSADIIGKCTKSQEIYLKITDTGIGMSPEFIKSVFEKFSQEEKSSARKFEGTGLGMAITKEIVHLMGGTIQVTGEKGVGTTVEIRLRLPYGDPDKIMQSNEKELDRSLSGLRCLLVEDNEMNRLIATKSLQHFGCEVTAVADGRKAIEALQQLEFDIVLMDIQMPLMDGLEATRYIREKISEHIPIIALTANAFKSDIDLYLSVGMNGYVTKPFEEYRLFNTIVNTLQQAEGIVLAAPRPAPVEEEPRMYDLSYIEELSGGDTSFIRNIISLFVSKTPIALGEMWEAFQRNDFVIIGRYAHELKPGIQNLRIQSLVPVIQELDAQGKSAAPDREKVESLLRQMEELLPRVSKQFEAVYREYALG